MAATPQTVFNELATATVTSGGTTASAGDNALVVSSAGAFTNQANSGASPPTVFDICDQASPSEVMTVTNQTGAGGVNWAVTRGARGTTRTTHGANWVAVAVATAPALAPVGLIIPASSGNGRIGWWTAAGAPTSGTWVAGDSVVDPNGMIWTCTASGTPGTWTSLTATAQGETDVRANSLSQFGAPTTALSMGSQRATSLAPGITATDAASYGQVMTYLASTYR